MMVSTDDFVAFKAANTNRRLIYGMVNSFMIFDNDGFLQKDVHRFETNNNVNMVVIDL